MSTKKVRIHLELGEENSLEVVKLTTIRLLSDDITYFFPTNLQNLKHHKDLFDTSSTVKMASKALTKVGQYRNITITLNPEIVTLYLDEDCNFVFKNCYLEELVENSTLINTPVSLEATDKTKVDLIRLIDKLSNKLETKVNRGLDISQIQSQFVLNKFQGKENARQWMSNFENECERHEIVIDEAKIQILRLFLEHNAIEWYSSTLCKLTMHGAWSEWQNNSFLETYGDKSWRTVYLAYTYKYINGSFLDYALKKERMLLETEPSMSDQSRINHIVVGLPLDIQDRLDKETINTTEQLMNQLRRYTSIFPRFKKRQGRFLSVTNETDIRLNESRNQKSIEKRPCSNCEARGYPGRFHPVEICR
uniref:Uncharacterized protein LOC114343259 n=1 Tax=Diabrotica virgifera virgifera TaxID=50390 RepID=A0A6P7GJP1_DIAVI